jgi:NADPH:quinone reductase-like Zn-dependent oxidoreductase
VQAVAIQAFGSPEGLAVIDLPDPSPAHRQVLIATEAIGVGGVDAMIRSGALAAYGFEEGHILGGEIACPVIGFALPQNARRLGTLRGRRDCGRGRLVV